MSQVDAMQEPSDLVNELTSKGASAWWETVAPSYRRNILRWIATAKTPETRAKRGAMAVDHACRCEKVPNY